MGFALGETTTSIQSTRFTLWYVVHNRGGGVGGGHDSVGVR